MPHAACFVNGSGSYDPASAEQLWPSATRFLDNSILESIVESAADSDRSGSLSAATIDGLRDAGYFGLAVPVEFEGRGATLLECCSVQRTLGSADPALAVALNMHLFSVGMMVEHWRRERDTSWALLEAVATQGRLIASGFAEPGLGGSVLRSNFTVRRGDSGYFISGTKSPCSLAARADLICLQVQEAENSEDLMVCLLPMSTPGIRIEKSWDTLGMRASESDSVLFDQCFVPDRLVFHRCAPGFDADPVFAAGLCWFSATTTASYIGLARAALKYSTTVLQTSRIAHLHANRSDLPSFQAAIGEAVTSLAHLELACLHIAQLVDSDELDPRVVLPAALSLKHQAVRAVLEIVSVAVETAGASAYSRRLPLERLWRDAQAIQFHPPTRQATRQIIGRWWLGQQFKFELDESPARQDSTDPELGR